MQGVPFPYWGGSFKWEAVGARDDRIEDRSAKTVFYDNPKGVRAAYTILGGDTIDVPSGASEKNKNGVKLFITTDKGRPIVTWTRDGNTCVLSAPVSVPEPKLFRSPIGRARAASPSR